MVVGPSPAVLSGLPATGAIAAVLFVTHTSASTFFSSGGSSDANRRGESGVKSAMPKCSCIRVATRWAALLQHTRQEADSQPSPVVCGLAKHGQQSNRVSTQASRAALVLTPLSLLALTAAAV